MKQYRKKVMKGIKEFIGGYGTPLLIGISLIALSVLLFIRSCT